MPGLLLCFVLRYDAYKKTQAIHLGECGVPSPNHLNRIRYLIFSRRSIHVYSGYLLIN